MLAGVPQSNGNAANAANAPEKGLVSARKQRECLQLCLQARRAQAARRVWQTGPGAVRRAAAAADFPLPRLVRGEPAMYTDSAVT